MIISGHAVPLFHLLTSVEREYTLRALGRNDIIYANSAANAICWDEVKQKRESEAEK
jgi:hypothetical protein